MKLEINANDFKRSEELFLQLEEIQKEDTSPLIKKIENEILAVNGQCQNEIILRHHQPAWDLRNKLESLFVSIQKVHDGHLDKIETQKIKLREVLQPYLDQMIEFLEKELKVLEKKKSFTKNEHLFHDVKTGVRLYKVTTNADDVSKAMQKIFTGIKNMKDMVVGTCPLGELEGIFNKIVKKIPATFGAEELVLNENEMVDFSRGFREEEPRFEEKWGPSLAKEIETNHFVNVLESLKSNVRVPRVLDI